MPQNVHDLCCYGHLATGAMVSMKGRGGVTNLRGRPVLLASGEEVGHRAGVGTTGMRIAYGSSEELQEAQGCALAGGGDQNGDGQPTG